MHLRFVARCHLVRRFIFQSQIRDKEEEESLLLLQETELEQKREANTKESADLGLTVKENAKERVRLLERMNEVESLLADAKNE